MSKFDPYEHLHITPNQDETLTRHLDMPTIEANPEATKGESAVSKDITLCSRNKTWVRVYRPTRLPSNDNTVARLPIVVFFHGGGFVLFAASIKDTHESCCRIASEIPSIVVSLNYRLAPENRLPAQYEDAMDAIFWVNEQALSDNGEQWLRDYGDFSRCYLCGRGCGGNMAYNAALRAMDLNIEPIKISGLILNQPMFGGKERTVTELKMGTNQLLPLPVTNLLWDLALPIGSDRDHPYCNPTVDDSHKSKIKLVPRCLVIGFNGDIMIDWTQRFVSMLVSSGVQVQAHFHDLGFRDIDLVDPLWANSILNLTKEFVV